jgi:DNA-binding NtrC family response regulator
MLAMGRIRKTSVASPSVEQVEQLVDDVLRCVRESILVELRRANRPTPATRKVLRSKREHAPPATGARSSPLRFGGRPLAWIEREAIRQTLARLGGNKAAAARSLGIAISTLYEKLKKYDL